MIQKDVLMTVIDLDNYPQKTEEILLALWERKKEKQGVDEKYGNEWIKRRLLASRTSLDKGQVRYRLDKLIEGDYVSQDTITEHNQPVHYFALRPNGVKSAKAIGEAKDVLGEIPEEVGQQDILMLTYELATARAEAEFGRSNANTSVVVQRFNQIDKKLNYLENMIEKLTENDRKTGDRNSDIEEKLTGNIHKTIALWDTVEKLENRIKKIEDNKTAENIKSNKSDEENEENSKEPDDEDKPGLKDFFQPP